MSLSPSERETTITFSDNEQDAQIYTSNIVMLRRFKKLANERSEFVIVRETDIDAFYTCPKKWVRITPSRQVSEEQKQRMRELGLKNKK